MSGQCTQRSKGLSSALGCRKAGYLGREGEQRVEDMEQPCLQRQCMGAQAEQAAGQEAQLPFQTGFLDLHADNE